MPWTSNDDLPKSVKDTLPAEAQTIWREIANNALSNEGYTEQMALATAWAGLKRSGWKKEKGKWSKVEKDCPTSSSVHVNTPLGEKDNKKNFEFKIMKADVEKRIAFGWSVISRDAAGNEVWDLQNDSVDPQDLEELAYKYVRFYRDSGELHNGSRGKAVLIESVVTTLEKQQVWGVPSGVMPVGWWTGFYVLDDEVWEKVKSGEYRAFSIEGSAVREKVI